MKSMTLILTLFVFAQNGFTAPGVKEEKETIRKSLQFSDPAGEKRMLIDNVNGGIKVTGYDGADVELVVYRTTFAESDEKLEQAKQEIFLDISEKENVIILYVAAPYRRRDGQINHRGWRFYGYDAEFDFELKVPKQCGVFAKTINDGEIIVRNVYGDYELENINGGILMTGACGSGKVYALNGGVTVEFDQNPKSDCSFGSLNGDVEVAFQPGFAADLRFKTFNGEVFTDFDVTYLSPRQASRERHGGKFVYKADKSFGARVGNGGPEIEFDGFNGDIHVVKQ